MTKNSILKTIKILGIAVAVVAIVVGITLLYNVVRKFYIYNKAIDLLSNDNFTEAYEIFDELGDYKESREYKMKCEYKHAIRLLKRGKYEAGYKKLEKLGSYNNADNYKNTHIYNRAVDYFNSGSYKEAEELFSRIKDFDDSSEWIKESKYQLAYQYSRRGNVVEAHKLYAQLEDYKDSAELVSRMHNFEPVKVIKTASCSEVGYMEYKCDCGATEVREIQKSQHDYKDATCTEPMTCKICGETRGKPREHTYQYAKCWYCGKELYPK